MVFLIFSSYLPSLSSCVLFSRMAEAELHKERLQAIAVSQLRFTSLLSVAGLVFLQRGWGAFGCQVMRGAPLLGGEWLKPALQDLAGEGGSGEVRRADTCRKRNANAQWHTCKIDGGKEKRE